MLSLMYVRVCVCVCVCVCVVKSNEQKRIEFVYDTLPRRMKDGGLVATVWAELLKVCSRIKGVCFSFRIQPF